MSKSIQTEEAIWAECERVNGNCSECNASDICENYDPIYDIEEW